MLMFRELMMFFSIGLELLVLIKLYRIGLVKRYQWFACMLITGLLRDLLLDFAKTADSEIFQITWMVTLVPYLFAQFVTVVSAYFRLAGLYQGIGRFAGWLYLTTAGCALCVCFVVNRLGGEPQYSTYVILGLLLERSMALILTGSTVLVAIFLSRFPSPLKKMPHNLVCHLALLIGLFGLTAFFQTALDSITNQYLSRVIEGIFFFFGNLCYIFWFKLLSAEGEFIVPWPSLSPDLAKSVRKLDADIIGIAYRISLTKRNSSANR